MAEDLRILANEHWREFYRNLVGALGGEWRRFGSADAFSTPHVPAPFANGVLVIEQADPDDVVDAIEWVSSPSDPSTTFLGWRVRIDSSLGPALLDAPIRAGLDRADWDLPGMVLMPIPLAPDPPLAVTTERVVADNFEDFLQAAVDTGFPRPLAEQAFELAATNSGFLEFFLGRLKGRPAAFSILVRTDQVAGIYSVATVEDARGHGLGTAVTWAAVGRAREWGVTAVVLQSTQMALRIYEGMGFRKVVEYATFGPAGSLAAD
jgi:GNAT superfamily N-acetyltransferase